MAARLPFQVLVVPFKKMQDVAEYLILKRSDLKVWQFVAGGGESKETPRDTAARELYEETGLACGRLIGLASRACIPVTDVTGELIWGSDVMEIPEHAFAYEAKADDLISLSDEHAAFK